MLKLPRLYRSTLTVSLVLLCCNAAAEAEIADIPSDQDNSIMEFAADGSCAVGNMYSGETSSLLSRRALIRFDVASEIPAGSTINSAALWLDVLQSEPSAENTDVYRLHRLQASWGESSGEGASECFDDGGDDAASGDVTWSHRIWSSTPWPIAGGVFDGTPSGSLATPLAGFAVWPSQPGMVADVQSWLDSPAGNFGWIVIGEESVSGTNREFSSREGVSPPFIEVNYTPPPPTTPPDVPDGRSAPPMRVGKLSANGSNLQISFDTALCTVHPDHNIIYGTRSNFPTLAGGIYGLRGSVCTVGASSPYTWNGSPDPSIVEPGARLLWFVVVANDGGVTEGSWGVRYPITERNGPGVGGASGECGMQTKSLANTCGHRKPTNKFVGKRSR